MKNRKSLLGLVLVVMVLVLGVGYAVVSSVDLTISGTATVGDSNLDVVISAANPNDTSTDYYGTVTNPAGLTATITVKNMTTVGDGGAKTITYTITNNETDYDAEVTEKSVTVDKSDYFDVVTSLASGAKITVPAGGTNTMTVTVKLKKMPMAAADATGNITITLKADPKAKA